MWVSELWRYPVKSMAGEAIQSAILTPNGIDGDRILHVAGPNGRVMTARTRPKLLGHRATLGRSGEPLVDGRAWDSVEVARTVEEAAGPGCRLARSEGPERFDILPLLVTTDGAIEAAGYDGRRFRPNIVIGGVSGLGERSWEGDSVRIGACVIGVEDLRQRCIMITFDPDTLRQDVAVLRRIQREFGGVLGLNCRVHIPGTIQIDDPVELPD